jgi:hypothetical protein
LGIKEKDYFNYFLVIVGILFLSKGEYEKAAKILGKLFYKIRNQ